MTTSAYMPFYISDFVFDTNGLDAEETGAYLMLICTYWMTGEPIPDNDKKLATISRSTSVEHWLNIRSSIVHYFDVKDGFWFHERVEEELEKYRQKIRKRQKAGKASGKARKLQGKSNSNTRSTHAQQVLNTRSTHDEQKANESESESYNKKPTKKEIQKSFDEWWELVPRKESKGAAEKTYFKILSTGKATAEELAVGITAYANHMAQREDGKRFTKHPSTWLNQECWKDEYVDAAKRRTSGPKTLGLGPG